VTTDDPYLDKYAQYEELFDPMRTDRQARRKRKSRPQHTPKKSAADVVAELADETAGLEGGFETTYRPSRYEEGWLLESLRSFYDRGLITDVLALIKGGKEASVYRCKAHPATELGFLAAKVYRPRMFRNLRNDAMYREGREVLTEDGRPPGKQAGTIARAIRNRTAFGRRAQHTSWLMHEYVALEQLYRSGGAVPRPVDASENAILMSYHGDEHMPAPTLNTITLEPREAERLFQEVLRNVDLMLEHGLIHGDLSAYNILYWAADGAAGEITLIDFPQVTDLHDNSRARFILERDITRICEYFAQQGLLCDPQALTQQRWARHVEAPDPQDLLADWSRWTEDAGEMEKEQTYADAVPL
jgi:RIO kinase 1